MVAIQVLSVPTHLLRQLVEAVVVLRMMVNLVRMVAPVVALRLTRLLVREQPIKVMPVR
jgi:hypothetical protein